MSKVRVRTRGLAYRLGIYGGTFVMGALLLTLLAPVKKDVVAETENVTSSTQASTGLSYVQQAWDLLPIFIGLLGMVMLLAGVVVETSRGGA